MKLEFERSRKIVFWVFEWGRGGKGVRGFFYRKVGGFLLQRLDFE